MPLRGRERKETDQFFDEIVGFAWACDVSYPDIVTVAFEVRSSLP